MKIKKIVLIAIMLQATLCMNASIQLQLNAATNALFIAQNTLINVLGLTTKAHTNSRNRAISDVWSLANGIATAITQVQTNSRNQVIVSKWLDQQAQQLLITAQNNSRIQAITPKWLSDYNAMTNAALVQQAQVQAQQNLLLAQANGRSIAVAARWNAQPR